VKFSLLLALVLLGGCASDADVPNHTHPDYYEYPVRGGSRLSANLDEVASTLDSATPVTVEDCVKITLGSSLNARSFEARLQAARGTAEAASAWPNPTIEYNVEDIGTVLDRQRQLLQQEYVHYPLFAFWTKGLETDVARAEEAKTAASVEEDKRQLRFEIGRAFYELLSEDEAIKNETEAVEIALRLADATKKRLALGDASRLDEQRARTEALDARKDLAKAVRDRTIDGIAFALALGAEQPVPVKVAPGWPKDLPADVATDDTRTLVGRALVSRPDMHEGEAALLRAAKNASLEDRRALPIADWNVALGASQGPEGYGTLFNLQAPLPLLDQNSGNKTRARADLESAFLELERTRRQVSFEVESALIALSQARQTLEEFSRPIVVAREESLDATRRLFAAGEVSYVDLLQSQRDTVSARRDLVEAEKEAALARWRLVVALGR